MWQRQCVGQLRSLDKSQYTELQHETSSYHTSEIFCVKHKRRMDSMSSTQIALCAALLFSTQLYVTKASENNPAVSAPVVHIPGLGAVQGKLVTDGPNKYPVEAFLGMRYAQPPVGQLRFRNSVAATPAEYKPAVGKSAYDASDFCFECTQDGLAEPMDKGMSEDCLCLNIWRPAGTTSSSKLPVYVFIHGGGFIIGASSTRWTVGAHVAGSSDVVVVSINYRLGPLGFLVTDEPDVKGNGGMNGIVDQILALKWVQGKIGAFGGDANLVTIGGQSSVRDVCTRPVLLSASVNGFFCACVIQFQLMLA